MADLTLQIIAAPARRAGIIGDWQSIRLPQGRYAHSRY